MKPPNGAPMQYTMATFAVTNWTQKKTHGAYPDETTALAALPAVLASGDEYSVWCMPQGAVSVGQEVDAGRS